MAVCRQVWYLLRITCKVVLGSLFSLLCCGVLTGALCSNRRLKMRCDKTKFLSSSLSTKSLFQNVLDDMFKCAPEENTGTGGMGQSQLTIRLDQYI